MDHLKSIINNWLKNTMKQTNLDNYDINSSPDFVSQNGFTFTKWNYPFEKPMIIIKDGKPALLVRRF